MLQAGRLVRPVGYPSQRNRVTRQSRVSGGLPSLGRPPGFDGLSELGLVGRQPPVGVGQKRTRESTFVGKEMGTQLNLKWSRGGGRRGGRGSFSFFDGPLRAGTIGRICPGP